MELYQEILRHCLAERAMEITFPNVSAQLEQIVQLECYQTLKKIKAVIEDDSLEDRECFMKIEEIVCAFEEMGSGGGFRHDFG